MNFLHTKQANFLRPRAVEGSYTVVEHRYLPVEYIMTKQDKRRPSLVEFLGSIKFSRGHAASAEATISEQHFARIQSKTRSQQGSEDAQLIRSAN